MKPAVEERPTVEVTREDQDDINAYALLVQRRSEQVEGLAVRLYYFMLGFFCFARSQLAPRLLFLFAACLAVVDSHRVWLCSHARCSCCYMPWPSHCWVWLLCALCASSGVLVLILLCGDSTRTAVVPTCRPRVAFSFRGTCLGRAAHSA